MTLNNTLILMAVSAAISAAATKFYFPNIQSKTVEIEKEVIKNNVVTVVRTVERPDGTKETTSETTDRTVKKDTSTKEAITIARKDWLVSASVGTKFTRLEPIYGVLAQRRILGPIYVGASVTTDKTVGVSVGLEF